MSPSAENRYHTGLTAKVACDKAIMLREDVLDLLDSRVCTDYFVDEENQLFYRLYLPADDDEEKASFTSLNLVSLARRLWLSRLEQPIVSQL